MELKDKNILVVGLGKSGISVCRFLKKRGACVTATDMALKEDLGKAAHIVSEMGVVTYFGSHGDQLFESADLIVLSPGVPHTIPPVKKALVKGVRVIGEMELASIFIQEPIVAVTGTNGKTTTTRLIGEILEHSGLKVYVGGNIGNPLIDYADDSSKADVVVAEVSSFQLDTIDSFKPKVSVLLNITEDHLDRYTDFKAYALSKARIFENQDKTDTAVINGLDPYAGMVSKNIKSRKLFFNSSSKTEKGAFVNNSKIFIQNVKSKVLHVNSKGLMGRHNRENAAAATLAAMAVGATYEGAQSVMDKFNGLPHRLEYVDTIDGIRYFDDSKATNVGAVARALETFDSPVILIMGGRDKGGDYGVLGSLITKHVKSLVVMGEAKKKIKASFGEFAPVRQVDSMKQAASIAHDMADPGDSVILSPACSSFDMFESYGQRGDMFKIEIARIKKEHQ
jgi:UDP-N-acetylmuramoylalanine--D-glutamate ligase